MKNDGLEEAQAGIKIARRNITNLRFADDTHPSGRKQRKYKEPLDESVGGERKRWLSFQKTKIMATGPITSWQTKREIMETVKDFIFLGSQITADGD